MSYSVKIKRSAAKELAHIAKPHRLRLIESIDALSVNPFRGTALKAELRGLRQIGVGDYRAIYELEEQRLVVMVVRVRYRAQAYQRE